MNQTADNPGNGADPSSTGYGGAPAGSGDPLLAQWDAATNAPPAQPASTIPPELAPVIRFAQGKMVEEATAAVQKEVDSAIGALTSGDDLKGVPKRIARGFLEAWALENPEFKRAFDQRSQNKKGWESALAEASAEFRKELGSLPSNSVRNDVEAAKASVRGTSNAPSRSEGLRSTKELRRMSDSEFRQYKADLLAGG